jgi:hypothetical protein
MYNLSRQATILTRRRSMYLLIQNEGVAPIEAFTRIGDSGTRHRSNGGLIGQFGSGNKFGITMLIRKGIEVVVYCGPNKLEFYPQMDHVTEADGTVRESYPIKCRVSGKINRVIECGWTLEMGALDWRHTSMALREFVSNAIDCSTIMESGLPVVQQEVKMRAKSGTTRVFVKLDPDVAEFYHNLSTNFLHFSADPNQVNKRFLDKNRSNLGPIVYREGVMVRKLDGKAISAFDYNFKAGEITIDEARNSSESALRAKIGQAINKADTETLQQLFEKLSEGDVYEAALDEFYLGYYLESSQMANWTGAWKKFAGDAVIASETMAASPIADHVKRKGHKVVAVKSDAFAKVAQNMGVPNISSVIGSHAADGRIDVDATEAAINAVDTVWAWCEATEMTAGKPKPETCCFRQLMDGGSEVLGYHVIGSNGVYIREDLDGKFALKVAIEEVAHYITGSTDMSRDFQNFAFDMIVELCV